MRFFGNTGNNIRHGVMGVLNKRIEEAQKEHDDFCRGADVVCESEKKEAEKRAALVKQESARAQINKVLGKLI